MMRAAGWSGTVAAHGVGQASHIMPGRPSACPSGLAGGGPVRQLADIVGSHAFAAFCVASC
ncbi:hypothetical protein, partial [Burkholderia sp. BCCCDS08]|uniref:hypothetical protein n=1 Tax=Burkholderia sp. BCCCDS08 TaxID=3390235 RepID=UPI003D2EB150